MVIDQDERLIIGKLRQGDVSSFDLIFKKYHRKVYFFALSYLKNRQESEDVVQEVFMNLWRFRNQINDNSGFSSYLFKITYNLTCRNFRKHASDKRHIDEVLSCMSQEDNSTRLDIEFRSLMERAQFLIEQLPQRQKTILLLSVREHLSTVQIAEKLNISKKTVENYMAVAKTSLRRSFADGGLLAVLYLCLFFS